MPWMTAWIDLQRQWVEAAARVMPAASSEAMRAIFADRYRQLFTPEFARIAPGWRIHCVPVLLR